ncbi:hypothetical protein KY328_05860 [Candidatus Woesearchaeota archaeon]|nr:hypothetical protein [Candidatus Woesearchaeota archaeon]MBW3022425.1 hypothetical protein [Candidatus Woesearchaeota archaeon]
MIPMLIQPEHVAEAIPGALAEGLCERLREMPTSQYVRESFDNFTDHYNRQVDQGDSVPVAGIKAAGTALGYDALVTAVRAVDRVKRAYDSVYQTITGVVDNLSKNVRVER